MITYKRFECCGIAGRVFELHREILKNAAFLAQRGETLPEHSRD
jgi:hypothetical protein